MERERERESVRERENKKQQRKRERERERYMFEHVLKLCFAIKIMVGTFPGKKHSKKTKNVIVFTYS